MGILGSLIDSIVVVIAALVGIGLFLAGGQQAAYGNETVGVIVALVGIVLMVFAFRH